MEHNEQVVVAGSPLAVGPPGFQDGVLQHLMVCPRSIHRVPVELLANIFHYCVEPIPLEPSPRLFGNPNRDRSLTCRERLRSPRLQSPRDFYGWIKITHVCKQWRNIALGLPLLWTSIQISSTPSARKLADMFIQRSGHTKLRIVAFVGETGPSQEHDSELKLREDCADIMDVVAALSPRTEALSFVISTNSTAEPVREISTNLNLDFSHLEYLELLSSGVVPFAEASFNNLVPDSDPCPLPRLKTLVTSLEPPTYLRWLESPLLETLEIRGGQNLSYPHWQMVSTMLTLSDTLVTLVLEDFQIDRCVSLEWVPVVLMPNLRRLDLKFSHTTWRVLHLLSCISASPTRLTIELGDRDCRSDIRNKTLAGAVHLMSEVGVRVCRLISPAILPLQTLRMTMSYHMSERYPEISVRGIRSESLEDDPALVLRASSLHIVKPFLLGTFPQLPPSDVTHLDLSCAFIENGIFHNIRRETWLAAFGSMRSVHTLTLSGFPPSAFLSALEPGTAFLFPELDTVYLKDVDFCFHEDMPMAVWGTIFLQFLTSRSTIPIEHLWIYNATNLTDHPINGCISCVPLYARYVDELHWDGKVRVSVPDTSILVDMTM